MGNWLVAAARIAAGSCFTRRRPAPPPTASTAPPPSPPRLAVLIEVVGSLRPRIWLTWPGITGVVERLEVVGCPRCRGGVVEAGGFLTVPASPPPSRPPPPPRTPLAPVLGVFVAIVLPGLPVIGIGVDSRGLPRPGGVGLRRVVIETYRSEVIVVRLAGLDRLAVAVAASCATPPTAAASSPSPPFGCLLAFVATGWSLGGLVSRRGALVVEQTVGKAVARAVGSTLAACRRAGGRLASGRLIGRLGRATRLEPKLVCQRVPVGCRPARLRGGRPRFASRRRGLGGLLAGWGSFPTLGDAERVSQV